MIVTKGMNIPTTVIGMSISIKHIGLKKKSARHMKRTEESPMVPPSPLEGAWDFLHFPPLLANIGKGRKSMTANIIKVHL